MEVAAKLLSQLVVPEADSVVHDPQIAAIEGAKEQSTALLRNFYKSEDIFLDMFEDENSEMQKKPLKVEWLMMDSNILLPPTGTPMTGIEFSKRLPCGEVIPEHKLIDNRRINIFEHTTKLFVSSMVPGGKSSSCNKGIFSNTRTFPDSQFRVRNSIAPNESRQLCSGQQCS